MASITSSATRDKVNGVALPGKGKTFEKREVSAYEASPGRFVVQLTARDRLGRAEVTFYDVSPIAGIAFGRAAFRFVKAEAKAERAAYSVLLDGDRSTCDCPHGTYKAHQLGPCRHVLAAQALVSRGKLPAPKPAPAPADEYRTDDESAVCWAPDDVVSLAPAV